MGLIGLLVGLHGLFFIATTLADELHAHRIYGSSFSVDVPLVVGLSLVYLSSRLLRRKRTAWVIAGVVYAFIFGYFTVPFLLQVLRRSADIDHWVRAVALPAGVVGLLALKRRQFVVRSDVAVFRSSLKVSAIVLLVAFCYGTMGFVLLDRHDFHAEVTAAEAMHRTVDQFGLTTSRPLPPYTQRARLFVDSLSAISIAAVAYTAVSLFAPLRARFHDQSSERLAMEELLSRYRAPSEDFFKLWPHDKQYYFSPDRAAGLAYRVQRGVALCVADPVGKKESLESLLERFDEQCYQNDWLPAFIHTGEEHRALYERLGFELQPIGREAVVHIDRFTGQAGNNKYFRNIRNRFAREGYSAELLQPPHHSAVLARLKDISEDWLSRPGRAERGFVMGYYDESYLRRCALLVARDAAGTIQGFMNQLPAPFDREEATYDLLRQTGDSLGNTNDFLLMNFIAAMQQQGYRRVNLGLSPLVGLQSKTEQSSIVDNFLRFVYGSGDRFYSFSGLYRFKNKYEPEWHDRFVAYRGGTRGFARTINALLRAMQVRRH